MSGIEVPTFPKIEARTHANGSGEVTINGTSYPIDTTLSRMLAPRSSPASLRRPGRCSAPSV